MQAIHVRTVGVLVAVLLAAALAGAPGATAAPVLGGQLYGTGGPATVEVLSSTAGYVSELRLCTEGHERFIALNTDVGTVVELGTFPAGLELVFCIFVRPTGHLFKMGPAERNPDGVVHARVEEVGPGVAIVGFEDLFGGGDQDYDDNVFRFTGVTPNQPPDCSGVTADAAALWPPDHRLVPVTVSGGTDPEGGPVTTTITAVTQDEPLVGEGTGNHAPDAVAGATTDTVELRRERSGRRDGRVYVVAVRVADDAGDACATTLTVTVPHDASGAAAVDSGQTVDSYGS